MKEQSRDHLSNLKIRGRKTLIMIVWIITVSWPLIGRDSPTLASDWLGAVTYFLLSARLENTTVFRESFGPQNEDLAFKQFMMESRVY